MGAAANSLNGSASSGLPSTPAMAAACQSKMHEKNGRKKQKQPVQFAYDIPPLLRRHAGEVK